ncbi:MAG: alpha/beta hydrolase [Gemmatimonadota bacterium]
MTEAIAAGDLQLLRFSSRVFDGTRWLRVLLPPGYADGAARGRRYPVLYLNDGQNLFDPTTAFGHVDWRVDETVRALVAQREIPPLIVVGIDHGGRRRAREYVPWKSRDLPIRVPEGGKYPVFLTHEVMPYVNARFRTRKGPGNTGLGGSSLGAAIALYTAIARPGVFGRLLVESPSLFLADRQLLRESETCRRWPRRVFLSVGTKEAGRPEASARMVADVRELERVLRDRGLGDDRLLTVVEEGATHGEEAWARRLPLALRFLYGARRPAGSAAVAG